MLFNSTTDPDPLAAQAAWHMNVMLHLFSMASLFMNNHFRGTRIHLYPLISGFLFYSLAFFFGIFEEITYYYYYLSVLISMLLVFFFGTTNFYHSFEPSGSRRFSVGCVITEMKGAAGNRVTLYYPTPAGDSTPCGDYKWAQDGEHTIEGLMKFGQDVLPKGPFRHLESIRQNVKVKAPVAKVTREGSKEPLKVVPIIFSHGIGNTMSWFSTIFKDLASQGHIVFSVEHSDRTALHSVN
jgi:hypothetical protein